MKIRHITFFFVLMSSSAYSQCVAPTNLFASNINFYNAEVNWDSSVGVNYYRIRYKEINNSSWLYANNIDSSLNTKVLMNLTPLEEYVWQIKAYCDSINTNTSSWSNIDTFTTVTNSCPNTSLLYITNINFNNAIANWDTVSSANRYKIRYRILGGTTWANLAPAYHPSNNIVIPLLLPSTIYEWQIKTYHDSSLLLSSLWSISDTFTTNAFIAAPFNPLIFNTLNNLQCNAQTGLTLRITQLENEPDIGSGTITSDGGYFNLATINAGDSVGYATMTTATQNINTVLRASIVLTQNYAVISSYDSAGALIGIFTIENTNNGVKVEVPGSPNDGNNYTSGYISEINFTNLFVNPASAGPLNFFADIVSELNDQVSESDAVQIWCATSTNFNLPVSGQITQIFDFLGRKGQVNPSNLQIIKFPDGTIKKQLSLQR